MSDFNSVALRNILFERKIQQKELAAKIGVTPNTVSKYILGKASPNFQTLTKICEVLAIPMDSLSINKQNTAAVSVATIPQALDLLEIISLARSNADIKGVILSLREYLTFSIFSSSDGQLTPPAKMAAIAIVDKVCADIIKAPLTSVHVDEDTD